MRGATAHRLDPGRRVVGGPQGQGKQRLHMAGAAAARGRGFGASTHFIDRRQLEFLNRIDDAAFRHAVAAANLRRVRQEFHPAALRHARRCRTEHQQIPQCRDIGAVTDELEIPAGVLRVAIQHRTDHPIAAQHQLLVHPARGIAEHDVFGPFVAGEISGREHIDPRYLQPGTGNRWDIVGFRDFADSVGGDLRLIPQRCHQTEQRTAMLHALANRVNRGIGGAHAIIDDNAAVARDAGVFRQSDTRANADGHHHEIGRDDCSIRQFDCLDPLRTMDRLGVCLGDHRQPAAFQVALHHPCRHRIELPLHQRRHQMQHGGLHAVTQQAVGGLQPQQPAADDHGVGLSGARRRHHGFHVGDVAERDHPRQLVPRHRNNNRVRSRSDQQHVVRTLSSVHSRN